MKNEIKTNEKEKAAIRIRDDFFKNTAIVFGLSISSAIGFTLFIASFPREVIITEFQLPLIIGYMFMLNMIMFFSFSVLDIMLTKTNKPKKERCLTSDEKIITDYLGD